MLRWEWPGRNFAIIRENYNDWVSVTKSKATEIPEARRDAFSAFALQVFSGMSGHLLSGSRAPVDIPVSGASPQTYLNFHTNKLIPRRLIQDSAVCCRP